MEWLFLIIILIFSVVIHEVSHGAVANHLGDPTAKRMGRLTLNPIKHLDPIGSIILPIALILLSSLTGGIVFGWAKPVPINPSNFHDKKFGSAKVALAGPLSNLFIALFFGLILRFCPFIQNIPNLPSMFSYIIFINILLFVFNLFPIPPLDGSHILFSILPLKIRNQIETFLYQFGLLILFCIIYFGAKWFSAIINQIFFLITGNSFFLN